MVVAEALHVQYGDLRMASIGNRGSRMIRKSAVKNVVVRSRGLFMSLQRGGAGS